MPKVQKDKYDILAEVALALRVKNRKVTIETLDAEDLGHAMWVDNLPHIPTHRTNTTFNGSVTISRLHANSIKIGKDISIKRIRRRPLYFEQNGQRYEVDNGWYYVVRTPKGEAKFDRTDNDFMSIWNYALDIHDGTDSYMSFANSLYNEKVQQAAWGPAITKGANVSKYEEAIKQLESLGIKPKNLVKYIDSKVKSI